MTSHRRLSVSPPSDTEADADNFTNSSSTDATQSSVTSSQRGMTANDSIRSTSSLNSRPRSSNNKWDNVIHDIARQLDIRKSMADRLRPLSNFEIVIVCDDSGSMSTPVDGSDRTRWDELCKIVKIILKIGVKFDSNGIDIHFLNRQTYIRVKDPTTVDEAFRDPPSGFTPLVPVLQEIFTSKYAQRRRDKKLLVLVATDGLPTDDDGNDVLEEFEDTMDRVRIIDTTHVSFLLCTDDSICVDYMREWDKKMTNVDVTDDYKTEKERIQECQKNKNFRFSYGDYVVKTLIGAIDPEINALNEFS